MEDKNKEVEVSREEKPEGAQEPQQKGLPTRSYILMCLAGMYLLYTGFKLCQNVINGVEGGNMGFFAAGIGFFIVGAVMLFIGGKNMLKRDKEKRAALERIEKEQAEAKKAQAEAQQAAPKKMSIAERARLAGNVEERDAQESGEAENVGKNVSEHVAEDATEPAAKDVSDAGEEKTAE